MSTLPQQPANARYDPNLGDQASVLRTVTFYMGLMLVFVKFAMLQEVQTMLMGFNGRLLYIFGIPAVLGVVLAGGLRRGMGGRPAYYWVAFALWMTLAVPFSSWRGSSAGLVYNYFKTDLVMLFVVAGLVVSWRECRLLVRVLAWASLCNLLSARLFQTGSEGRLSLEFGMVSNSNDFAGHLLLTLPFLLLVAYTARSFVWRSAALAGVAAGAIVILKTASRGALIALIVDVVFLFLRGGLRQRLALACLVPVGLVAALMLVPASTLQRLRSFSAGEKSVSAEALESSADRQYLLRKSIEYTLQFPLFGVGPGQFANYEGENNRVIGSHGMYHSTHNSFTQASSECGIPAGLLMLAAWVSSFLLVNRTYGKAKKRSDCRDIQLTSFCIMLSILGFCAAIFFLNFAYFFYGPAMGGLAISVWRAADYEFEHRARSVAAVV